MVERRRESPVGYSLVAKYRAVVWSGVLPFARQGEHLPSTCALPAKFVDPAELQPCLASHERLH